MSAPFIGEIRMFPYAFAPRGWAYCQGQLISIAQNSALFSIIGNIYGGDARITMGLPNLMGRAPIGAGLGPGLTNQQLGWKTGEAMVQLSIGEIPSHTHTTSTYKQKGTTNIPSVNEFPAIDDQIDERFYVQESENPPLIDMATSALATAGQSERHENRQPFLGMSFFINLDGLYPSRN